jgi:ferrous iron transport protein A
MEGSMPLHLVRAGEKTKVRRIGGNGETKKRLETLGFTAGSAVEVLSHLADSVIVSVKDSRVALSGETARLIMVSITN